LAYSKTKELIFIKCHQLRFRVT